MADLSNISLSSNVGDVSHGGGTSYYSDGQQQQKKQENPSKLRAGEIIRGTITERMSDEVAFVRIPTGTFKAIVSSNLKIGDSLLFKVMETSPSLVLKVHEVYAVLNNEPVETRKLVRMLDLPQVELNEKIVASYKLKRRTILRDDILEIYRLISKGSGEFAALARIDTLIRVLVEMQVSKLPLSVNLIKKLLPLFVSENDISTYLNVIEKNLSNLPVQISNVLASYFNDIKKNNYKKNNLFILSLNSDQPSFFELLDTK